jgi:surface protein
MHTHPTQWNWVQNLSDTTAATTTWGPIGDWDVSGVGDFSFAFSKHRDEAGGTYKKEGNPKAAAFVGTDMSKWITTSLATLSSTFYDAGEMVADLSGWKVDMVTSLYQTFRGASKFVGTGLGSWITTKVTSLTQTFTGASKFVGTGLASWNTASVTHMDSTFEGAVEMVAVLSGWKVGKVTALSQTFKSASKFIGTDLGTWDTASATSLSGTFYDAGEMVADLSGWKVDKVTSLQDTFRGASKFVGTGLGSWITTMVTSLRRTFQGGCNGGCSKFVGTGLASWDTSSVTDMCETFKSAVEMNADLSGWQTGKATTLRHMFYRAYKFNSDLSSWDTSRVTNDGFKATFEFTKAFNSNLQKWDVAKATTVIYIFRDAIAFKGDGMAAWADVVVNSNSDPWDRVFNGATSITPCNKKRIFDAWTKGNAVAANKASVNETSCLELAVALFGSKVTATKTALQTGTWSDVPSGCSVHSKGDWAAYYTTNAPTQSTADYTTAAVPSPMDAWRNEVCDPVRHHVHLPRRKHPPPTHPRHIPHTLRRRVANRLSQLCAVVHAHDTTHANTVVLTRHVSPPPFTAERRRFHAGLVGLGPGCD